MSEKLNIKEFSITEHPIKYEGSNSLFLHGQTIIESKEINIVADVEISWYYSTNSGSYYSPSSTELTDENISIYIIEVLNENGNIEITQENEAELKQIIYELLYSYYC